MAGEPADLPRGGDVPERDRRRTSTGCRSIRILQGRRRACEPSGENARQAAREAFAIEPFVAPGPQSPCASGDGDIGTLATETGSRSCPVAGS